MSSILKALRRLEEDRARKSSVAPEIAASLLRGGSQRRQSPLWVWPTVITIVALTVASLFWSLRSAPVQIDSARKMLALAPATSPVNISSDSPAGRGGEVIIEEVIDHRQPVLLPPRPAVSPTVLLPVRANPVAQSAKPGVTTAVEKIKSAAPPIEERHSPVVSAIAWQEDSSARMAVVDGLPVMTGESIGTAKIAEIQRDRILFVSNGIFFTVRIDPQ